MDKSLKLVRCSFTGSMAEHDKISVDYFIDAIADPEIQKHLMQNEPVDIYRLYLYALLAASRVFKCSV